MNSIKDIHLEKEVIDRLEKTNWTPNRRVTIDHWKNELSQYNLISHILSDNVLKNFGGLTIGSITFNPIIETSLMFNELREVNDESGFSFFPIGINQENDIMIAINEKGKIFGMMSDLVFKYGDNLEESLNCLLRRKKSIEHIGWNYDEW